MTEIQHLQRLGTTISIFICPAIAVIIAATTSGQAGSINVANIALILAIVTIASAVLAPIGGLLTSVTAAASLTYFHTEPIGRWTITSSSDILMVTLLLVIGFGVSSVSAMRLRAELNSYSRRQTQIKRQLLLSELLTETPLQLAWLSAVQSLDYSLSALNVRLVDSAEAAKPIIARKNETSEAEFVTVPESGALLHFQDPRLHWALLVIPRNPLGSTEVRRAALFAFAQQLELALIEPEIQEAD